MTDPGKPLIAWGFDPIYFAGPRMTVADLDAVSATRMIVVAHVSGHILNVNSAVLQQAGFSADSNLEGLLRDAAGQLTGELLGPVVMGRANRVTGDAGLLRALDVPALRDFGAMARRVGVTTSTDLANALTDDNVAALRTATAEVDFPIRLVPAMRAREYSVPDGIAHLKALQQTSTDRLHFGIAKLVVDGSIQGFSARLRWPGYHNGAPNGLWYVAPAELGGIVEAYHRAGLQLHIHTNGDEASERATEMVGRAIAAYPRADHRHTLQHCQMADEAIFRRMQAFGMCANLFANHIYYWGEQHRARDHGSVARDAAGCLQHRARRRRSAGDPFGYAGDADRSAVHHVVRRQSHDRGRQRAGSGRTHHRGPGAACGDTGCGLHAAARPLHRQHRCRQVRRFRGAGAGPARGRSNGDTRHRRSRDGAGRARVRHCMNGIPLTVIGGFLGAGKTTLVNRLLQTATRRWGVLVNDFGAINIDAALIASRDGDTIALTNGCVCCGMGDDLGAGLSRLAARVAGGGTRDHRGKRRQRSLADRPVGLVEPGFSLEPIVVVVDAASLLRMLDDRWVADTVRRQIEAAEVVALSKTDLACGVTLSEVEAAIRAIRPDVRLVDVGHGALSDNMLRFPNRASAPIPRRHPSLTRIPTWHYVPPRPLGRARLRSVFQSAPRVGATDQGLLLARARGRAAPAAVRRGPVGAVAGTGVAPGPGGDRHAGDAGCR